MTTGSMMLCGIRFAPPVDTRVLSSVGAAVTSGVAVAVRGVAVAVAGVAVAAGWWQVVQLSVAKPA